MLASCPQDLFFNNNHKDKRSRHFHHQQPRKDSMMSTNSDLMIGLNVNDMSDLSNNNNNNKDKEEQVWPLDVESAFIEGVLCFLYSLCTFLLTFFFSPLKHWNQSPSWVEEKFLLMENLVVAMN